MVLDDGEKSIELTMAGEATLKVDDMDGLLSALHNLHTLCPIATVTFAAPLLTVTTVENSDTFVLTVNEKGNFNPGGTGFWTEDEFTSLRGLCANIKALVRNNGVAGVSITYA